MSQLPLFPRTFSIVAALMIVGCAQAPKPMYMWESFPRQQYDTLLREGLDTAAQIQAMEAHAEKARAANAALPPGFRMHLGMLHLTVGNASAASRMWQAEKLAFPESAPYVETLIKRLQAPGTAVPKDNPV